MRFCHDLAQAVDVAQAQADGSDLDRPLFEGARLLAGVDVGPQYLDAVAPGISDQHLGWIETHGLVVEQGTRKLGREVGLEVKGLVGHQRKGRGVDLQKP